MHFPSVVEPDERQRVRVETAACSRGLDTLGRGRPHGSTTEVSEVAGRTSDGELFSVGRGGVAVCHPTTAECRATPLPAGVSVADNIRVMGLTYES